MRNLFFRIRNEEGWLGLYFRRQWNMLKTTLGFEDVVAIIILMVGIVGLIDIGIPYLGICAEKCQQFHADIQQEAFGIGITVLLVDTSIGLRSARERKLLLLRQMRIWIMEVAVPAVDEMRAAGWLFDGSLFAVNLPRAKLQGAHLSRAKLQGTDLLWKANLEGAQLHRSNLQEAMLWGANLQRADLRRANLQGADLTGVKLQGADLSVAKLQGAELWKANLQGADLRRANLQEANTRQANLQGVNLFSANLQGVDLWEANLRETDLEAVSFNEKTSLPDGSGWKASVDMTRFTDPEHPEFWRSDDPSSPAYKRANDQHDPHYAEWQEQWGNKE